MLPFDNQGTVYQLASQNVSTGSCCLAGVVSEVVSELLVSWVDDLQTGEARGPMDFAWSVERERGWLVILVILFCSHAGGGQGVSRGACSDWLAANRRHGRNHRLPGGGRHLTGTVQATCRRRAGDVQDSGGRAARGHTEHTARLGSRDPAPSPAVGASLFSIARLCRELGVGEESSAQASAPSRDTRQRLR